VPRQRTGGTLTPSEVLARYKDGPTSGVFTDGACEGNPGPGGWAFAWVEDDRVVREANGGESATTNNRMELRALIEAYRALPETSEVTVFSDSEICVKTVNEWAAGWERRGWRRKGGSIKNLELVQELFALARARPGVKLQWIRAHDGSRWNEYVDARAVEGIPAR
jgi:ribonuclease HI